MQKRLKILRISPAPVGTKGFRTEAGLNTMDFDGQIKVLKDEGYILPGSWSAEMEKQGFEVADMLYPDKALSARWARENGLHAMSVDPDPLAILFKMVSQVRPDVIFIYAGAFFHITREIRNHMRAICGPSLVITGFWGDELHSELYQYNQYFGDLDFVFVSSTQYFEKFNEVGIDAVLIGNAFDPAISFDAPVEKDIDLLFCGTTGFRVPEHLNRYNVLKEIIPRTNITIYSREPEASSQIKSGLVKLGRFAPQTLWQIADRVVAGRLGGFLPRSIKLLIRSYKHYKDTGVGPWVLTDQSGHPQIGKFDFHKPLNKTYPSRFHTPVVKSSEYHNLIARAKIVLNIHRDEEADVGNIRCYEVTGVGSCLLTDRGEELSDRFELDKEIVGFKTANDLVEKVEYLLSRPDLLAKVSKAGQERTLKDHTVAERCQKIGEKLKSYLGVKTTSIPAKPHGSPSVLFAKYDTQGQPISYDVSFFLQAAEIRRRQLGCDKLVVGLVPPKDIENQPGVSREVNSVVDGDSRRFRMSHILGQMADMLPNADVIHMKDREIDPFNLAPLGKQTAFFPEEGIPHHSTYYQLVNQNPDLMPGFEASLEAHRYVQKWLAPMAKDRDVLCLSLRQYKVDEERNNNIEAWYEFLESLDETRYCVTVVPDTDAVREFNRTPLAKYPIFHPACFDVDLRFALYEQAFLNFFVNNGPCVAATLNKNINYLMFKLLTRGVPTTDLEFIQTLGFENGKSPRYATPAQKWVWEDDTNKVIAREFSAMETTLYAARRS